MSFATTLHNLLKESFHKYEESDGYGSDAYHETTTLHPMADGKYLQSLAVLRSTGLISIPHFQQRSLEACDRIEKSAIKFEDGVGWGLGFSWRNLSPTEPFLITTAIVTRGLLDSHHQGLVSDRVANILHLGSVGLERWIRNHSISVNEGHKLPVYSPNIREPIYNAASYAFGTLKLIDKSEGRTPSNIDTLDVMKWIGSRRVAGLGWTYSLTSPIVDLLHQCYILNSLADLFGAKSVEKECIEMLGQFAGPCCFADAIRLVIGKEELSSKRDIPWLRSLGDFQLELLPKRARLWSLGELLVLLSRLGEEGENSEAWVRQARQVAELIMSRLSAEDDVEAQYPRHTMHALHGLTAYLALLRKRAQKNTNTGPEP